MATDWLNEQPYQHLTRHAFLLRANRCDLRGGAVLQVSHDATDADIAEASAQAFGYHAANILPRLNGFAGYDCVRIEVVRV